MAKLPRQKIHLALVFLAGRSAAGGRRSRRKSFVDFRSSALPITLGPKVSDDFQTIEGAGPGPVTL